MLNQSTSKRTDAVSAGLLAALILACVPATVRAQTGQTGQIPLQFDFLNPGARSLGIGSAFIAVADDATAAFTNPAGLTQIVWPEASLELRYRALDTRFLAGGRVSGFVTNTGIDTVAGSVYGTSADAAMRPYFLSFVYPKGRWSVAAYRHELVLQENAFVAEGVFQRVVSVGGQPNNNVRNPGLAGDRRISVDNYGAAVAFRVNDRLSVGAGIAALHFRLDSNFGALRQAAGIFSLSDPATRGFDASTTQTGDEVRFAANAGVRVRLHRMVQAGVVYRQGATFGFTQVTDVAFSPEATQVGEFRTPNVIGAGVRVQAPDRPWSVAVDYNWVQYSRLEDSFITLQVPASKSDRISVNDGSELHIGGEYRFTRLARPPSIRAGVWFDPDHSVQYASDESGDADDQRLQAVFPGGEDLWHYCVGFGLPISRTFEFNLGADMTRLRKYVSMSIVARFPR